ncbi:DUF262 domain-containing protein [Clostridiaceae bacterium 35-E11]
MILIRLIETIIIGYIVPSLYFWDAETDATTGQTITHIVDGQQRVNALVDFIEGKFTLLKPSLTQLELSEKFANKRFCQLSDKDRISIWSYNVPVAQLSENEFWSHHNLFNAGDIKRMKDIEFCASLILLARDEIINQTIQKPLNDA